FQGNWSAICPQNLATQQMGRIDPLWVDPNDQEHILAGSLSGGLFEKTANNDWVCLTNNLPGIGVLGISVYKTINENIIAIATALNGNGNNITAGYGWGIYYTEDNGATWIFDEDFYEKNYSTYHKPPNVPAAKFMANGSDGMIAISGNKIWRKATVWGTWENITPFNRDLDAPFLFNDFEFLPNSTSFWVCGEQGENDTNIGLYYTLDNGASFINKSTDILADDLTNHSLKISISNNNDAYVLAIEGDGNLIPTAYNIFHYQFSNYGYDLDADVRHIVDTELAENAFAVSPTDPSVMYCGKINFFKSVSGGHSFRTPGGDIWTAAATFPGIPRTGAVGFVLNGKIYLGTGYNEASGYLKDFWQYDPSLDTWSQKADFAGLPRAYAVGFDISGKGYVLCGGDATTEYKDFYEFDYNTNIWTLMTGSKAFQGEERKEAVSFTAPNAWNKKAYVGTGIHSGQYLSDFWQFIPEGDGYGNYWLQKQNFPSARAGAVAFNASITKGMVGTGYNGTQYFKNFWEYDATNNVWNSKADLPGVSPERKHAFSTDNNASYGYVIGGYNNGTYLTESYQYSNANDSWAQISDYPGGGISGGSVFFAGTALYGGLGFNGTNSQSQFYSYENSSVGGVSTLHADVRSIYLYQTSANPGSQDVIYVGNDGGVSKSVDGGVTWINLNANGLCVTQFNGISGVEERPELLFGGTQDNSVWKIENGNATIDFGGDGYETESYQNSAAPDDVILFYQNGPGNEGPHSSVQRFNYGVDQYDPDKEYSVKPILQPEDPEQYTKPMLKHIGGNFYVGINDLYISINHSDPTSPSGYTPAGLTTFDFNNNYNTVRAFEVSPNDEERIWVAFNGVFQWYNPITQSLEVYYNKQLFIHDPDEPNIKWKNKTPHLGSAPENYPTYWNKISTIAADPDDPEFDRLWVAFDGFEWDNSGASLSSYHSGSIWLTENTNGDTWQTFNCTGLPNFPIETMVYQRGTDDIIYAGTDAGIYRWKHTPNQSATTGTWECFSSGLPAC
ncbi:MAG: hypothetical protein LH473_12955, partial [Chitinophagales bacterium]|nr:hypothetical protein [Chitinophagales bacterium]